MLIAAAATISVIPQHRTFVEREALSNVNWSGEITENTLYVQDKLPIILGRKCKRREGKSIDSSNIAGISFIFPALVDVVKVGAFLRLYKDMKIDVTIVRSWEGKDVETS